jgi:hypothetical protein
MAFSLARRTEGLKMRPWSWRSWNHTGATNKQGQNIHGCVNQPFPNPGSSFWPLLQLGTPGLVLSRATWGLSSLRRSVV